MEGLNEYKTTTGDKNPNKIRKTSQRKKKKNVTGRI